MNASKVVRLVRTQSIVLVPRELQPAAGSGLWSLVASGHSRPLHPATILNRTAYHYTSSSSSQARAQSKPVTSASQSIETLTTPLDATSSKAQLLNPDIALSSTLNPPASTRPPPLEVPTRAPDSSLFAYLFKLGKAYTGFYKAGLQAIFTNRRLLREVSHSLNAPPNVPGADTMVRPTRAAILLRERMNHDLARLPIFGLLVLVCGEFTPLIVIAFPKLTPYTCRIPKQIQRLRSTAQARREASIRNLKHVTDPAALEKVTPGHIVRTLGLGSTIWDKAGVDPPFATSRAAKAIRKILKDDLMISEGGGAGLLESEEVVLACEERAMDVQHTAVEDLRRRLDWWVRETTKEEGQGGEATVRRLLTRTGEDTI